MAELRSGELATRKKASILTIPHLNLKGGDRFSSQEMSQFLKGPPFRNILSSSNLSRATAKTIFPKVPEAQRRESERSEPHLNVDPQDRRVELCSEMNIMYLREF